MEHHDYHIASEPDVSGAANRQIWFYFIVLGTLLFLTLSGLTIMYRFQVDYEKERKIGQVNTDEALDQKVRSQKYLSGEKGIFEDKAHVSIDEAMKRYLSEVRRAK
jgi:hypothetical protein